VHILKTLGKSGAMCADVQWIVMVTPLITLQVCGPTSWPMDPDLFTFADV
jgi:hypothetical protein